MRVAHGGEANHDRTKRATDRRRQELVYAFPLFSHNYAMNLLLNVLQKVVRTLSCPCYLTARMTHCYRACIQRSWTTLLI